MTKHTPGPWKIGALESGQAAVDGADGSEVTGFISIPDAHLIAAAPELLALCEELLPELACRCDEGFTSRGRHEPNALCHYHDDLRAAVAKARGEKP
jgi:hypothetical protein